MSPIFLAQLLLAIVVAHTCSEPILPVCPPNTEYRCKNLCEPTCNKPNEIVCSPRNQGECCRLTCQCIKGWVRNKNTNECVKLSDCPKPTPTIEERSKRDACPGNETLNLCGRLCEPTCENRNPNPITCPRIECTKGTEGCRCDTGFLRDDSGDCVLPGDCPDSDE